MGKFLLSTLLLLTTAFASTAERYSFTFSSTTFTGTNQTKTLTGVAPGNQEVEWTLTTDTEYCVTESNNGLHLGSGSKTLQNVELETSFFSTYKISEVIVNVRDANSTAGNVSVKVGESSFLCDSKASIKANNNATDYTFVGSDSGDITISIKRSASAKKAIYIKSITVIYEDGQPIFPTKCEEPVFSVNGKEVAKESTTEVFEGNTISVTCPTKDSTIEWGYQLGETKYPLEESKFTIPTDFNVGATYTFYANASCTGENNAKLESSSSIYVTVVKKPNVIYTNKFKKVTDASELEAGAKYVVAYFDENGSKTMSTTASTSDRSATDITITDGVLTATEETLIITLEGETGKWKLNAENYTGTDKYLLFNQTYKTDIRMASASDATEANISITTDGNVEIQAASNGGSRLIKYNGSDSFKYYANPNGSMCQLYRQIVEIAPEAPADPEFSEEHTEIVNGTLTSEKSEYSLKFKKVEGVDIYYRHILKDNNTTTRAEVVDHSGFTKVEDADYEKGIKVTKDHSALEYYAFANGVKSETKTLNVKLDTPTGVAEIEAAGAGEVRWFDMQGREVKGQPEKGIYVRVVNGRASKVIL